MTVTDDGRYTSTLCFSSSSQCYIFRPSSEVLGEVADETADEFSIAYTAEMSDETAREIITKVFEKQSGVSTVSRVTGELIYSPRSRDTAFCFGVIF